MTKSVVPPFVVSELARLGIDVGEPVLAQLARYLDLLLEANQRFNLTAIRDTDLAWRRHLIDSLTLLRVLDELAAGNVGAVTGGLTVVDVGSGGGLPGVPLAIARPQWRMTLLEATAKKARFLQQCVERLSLASARVVNARAELVGRDRHHRQKYDVAVCRAVGPMAELLEYTLPLVRVGGTLLAMKGPSVAAELDVAGDALAVLGGGDLDIVPAYADGDAMETVIVRVRKERVPTPADYPRPPGVPRQSPLG